MTNTESLPARYVPPGEFDWKYQKNQPGDWTIVEEDGRRNLICCLPGGHYGTCPLRPVDAPQSWTFNESFDQPSLTPSVHCIGTKSGGGQITLWHGWLRDGEWVSC